MSTVTDLHDAAITEIFTGRGATSILRAYLGSGPPDVTPDPATVATLPVGRRFLTATTEADFVAALEELVEAWVAGGFGLAGSGYRHELPTLDEHRHDHHHRTYLDVTGAYTFDGDRVLYLRHGRPQTEFAFAEHDWQAIALSRGLVGEAGVALIPMTRVYGESYPQTAALTLPQLGVWLLAELTRRAASDTAPIWPTARFAIVVNTTLAQIRLYLYGIGDTPGQRREPTAAHFDALDHLHALVNALGWTNPSDESDHRFTLDTHVVADYEHHGLRQRGRIPGTVTVTDDADPFWR